MSLALGSTRQSVRPLFCCSSLASSDCINIALIVLSGHVPGANIVSVAFCCLRCGGTVIGGRCAIVGGGAVHYQIGRPFTGKCAPNDQSVNHHLISLIAAAVAVRKQQPPFGSALVK